jgi:hypothetical protein
MNDLKNIPAAKADLDRYEVETISSPGRFSLKSHHPGSYPQKVSALPQRTAGSAWTSAPVSSATTLVTRTPGVVDAICKQARTLTSFAPSMSTQPRALLTKMLAEINTGGSFSFLYLPGGG